MMFVVAVRSTLVVCSLQDQIEHFVHDGFLPSLHFVSHFENAVSLCALCHRALDDCNNPGLVFIPADLDYFVEWEEADFTTREELLARDGKMQPRSLPSTEVYRSHCADQCLESDIGQETMIGGLYKRWILNDYFPSEYLAMRKAKSGADPYPDRKPWPGLPFAALHQGLLALGPCAGG